MAAKIKRKKERDSIFGFKRKKSLTKRLRRAVLLVSLIIFLASTFMNWRFMETEFIVLLGANADTTTRYAAALLEQIEGAQEFADSVMETYRSIPADVRENMDSEEYRAYFEMYEDSDYAKLVSELFSSLSSSILTGEVYIGMFDEETKALVYIINPVNSSLNSRHRIGDWESATEEEIQTFLYSDEGAFSVPETGRSIEDEFSIIPYNRNAGKHTSELSAGIRLSDEDGRVYALIISDVPQIIVTAASVVFTVIYLIVVGVIILVILIVFRIWMNRRVVKPIKMISEAAENYARDKADGNVEEFSFGKLSLNTKDELQELSTVLAEMEKDISQSEQKLIRVTAERERISTELSVANQIQENMLPKLAPPFIGRYDFNIYATMTPAKEVGGDFYDYFMIDPDHIGLVMADVSGKGIPAALFMMSSMIIIDNFASLGYSPARVLELSNEKICGMELVDMFVTVWFGILDLRNGLVTAANAGHEYPAICHAGGQFELFKDRHGFVVGGMEGIHYKNYTFTLEPGSSLFLYTDGVPEASNAANEFYGTDRMISALNVNPDASPEELLKTVRADIDGFVGEAPRFDDLTMMCIRYYGREGHDGVDFPEE